MIVVRAASSPGGGRDWVGQRLVDVIDGIASELFRSEWIVSRRVV
jgi:hypothetical protein